MKNVLLLVLLLILEKGPLFTQEIAMVPSVEPEKVFAAFALDDQDDIVQIHVLLSQPVNDSLIIFHGDDRNIFELVYTESGVQRVPLDAHKYKKVVLNERVFESHVIRVPGVRPSEPRFIEKFYRTSILELFEQHSSSHGKGYVIYFAKFRDSPFLFRLAAMNGEPSSIMPLISIDFMDPLTAERPCGMVISRDAMIKVGQSIEKGKIRSYFTSK